MKHMKHKKLLSGLIIIGLVLIVSAFITRIYADKMVAGILFGVGFTAFGLSTSKLLSIISDEKHPELAEIKTIEINDERNVIIRHKAQATAGKIQQYLIIVFAYLLMILDSPLYLIILVVAIYLSFTLLTAFYYTHYQKKM